MWERREVPCLLTLKMFATVKLVKEEDAAGFCVFVPHPPPVPSYHTTHHGDNFDMLARQVEEGWIFDLDL